MKSVFPLRRRSEEGPGEAAPARRSGGDSRLGRAGEFLRSLFSAVIGLPRAHRQYGRHHKGRTAPPPANTQPAS